MKITKTRLKGLIDEEVARAIVEFTNEPDPGAIAGGEKEVEVSALDGRTFKVKLLRKEDEGTKQVWQATIVDHFKCSNSGFGNSAEGAIMNAARECRSIGEISLAAAELAASSANF